MKVIFPIKENQHYYDIHYKYVLNLFEYEKCDIELKHFNTESELYFRCIIDGIEVVFDFADNGYGYQADDDQIVFRFHCYNSKKNIIPFSPVSFYDWNQYLNLRKEINYIPFESDMIRNCQRPYGNSIVRRRSIQDKMYSKYCNRFDIEITGQVEYWKKINDCMIGFFIPGQNNNILDRGQFQYMAFGCCTMSPNLPEILPYNKNLNERYLPLENDYSDVDDMIQYALYNRGELRHIGDKAKQLFEETSTPEKLIKWIKQNI
jgi:hypothetical protein